MATLNNALEMLYLLSVKKYKVDELAVQLEMSERAVRRLKDTLVYSGYDIQTDFGPNGGYYLKKFLNIPSHLFSSKELEILKNSFDYLTKSRNFVSSKDTLLTLGKLSNHLFEHNYAIHSYYDDVILNVDLVKYIRYINQLEMAIKDQVICEVSYKKTNIEKKYTFKPYSLANIKNMWYIEGYDQYDRFISLKVNRITKLTLTNIEFDRDEMSNESKIKEFGFKINPIHIKLDVYQAPYLSEYIWGENQTIQWIDENEFILEVTFSNDLKAKSFLLEHGPYITVLEPENLKKWYLETLETIIKKYQRK